MKYISLKIRLFSFHALVLAFHEFHFPSTLHCGLYSLPKIENNETNMNFNILNYTKEND